MTDTGDIKSVIAAEAVAIVSGARRRAYGRPEDNFGRIVRLWNAHLHNRGLLAPSATLLETDVAALMRQVKEARLAESPDHRDSYVDLVGYSLCGAELALQGEVLEHEATPAISEFKIGDRVNVRKSSTNSDPVDDNHGTISAQDQACGAYRFAILWDDGSSAGGACIWRADELVHVPSTPC